MVKNFWLKRIQSQNINKYKRLEGGVSSEVYKVETKNNIFCIKRCLPKLLVKKEWYADINRLKYEYYWLQHVKKILPNNVPQIYEYNKNKNYLSMDFLDEKKFKNLKYYLLKGKIDQKIIIAISKNLFKIHSQSTSKKLHKKFNGNYKNFYDLRLDAYFNESGRVHPKFLPRIKKIINNYNRNKTTLVHGDFSPKNILISKNRHIFLDAETCNIGDPVFDVVFFTNHLLIKSIYISKKKKEFLKAYKSFFYEYLKLITWENKELFYKRCLEMIPLMLIARIDGKSPVEYIKNIKLKNRIRNLSFLLLNKKYLTLNELIKIFADA